jgi:hypothetical protein
VLPGKWGELLGVLDFITIQGGSYRVCVPVNALKKKRPASASSAISYEGEMKVGSGKSDRETGRKQASYGRKKRPGSKGSSKEGSVSGRSGSSKVGTAIDSSKDNEAKARAAREAEEAEAREAKEEAEAPLSLFDSELVEAFTDNHITLDRPWLLDDVFFVEIYKKMPRILYYKPLFFAARKGLQSYPLQKATAVLAVTHHKYGRLLQWLSANFEEDSDRFASLQRQALRAHLTRDEWLQLSESIVQMSFDFTMRRQLWSTLMIFYAITASGVRRLRGITKSLGVASKETPFEYWKRSNDKTDISVVYDKGNDVTSILGPIKMDLKAPVEIMREYVMRAFRLQLNPTIGSSFLFFKLDKDTLKEVVLSRTQEFKTYSKDFCFEKTDNKTMLTVMTVLITADASRGRVTIPEYEALKDEDGEDNKALEEMENLL